MRPTVVGLALATLLIAAVPASAVEAGVSYSEAPAQTAMFVHLLGFADSPINTQEPPAHFIESRDIGIVQHSQGCVDNPSGTLLSEPHHTFYGYGHAGVINYLSDQPRSSHARGLGYDVQLQNGSDVQFHWSLASQIVNGPGEQDVNQAPSVVPNVILRATIREGDQISVGGEAYNTGKIIAQGQSEPVTLAGPLTPDHPQVTHGAVGTEHVYDFSFPLELAETTIRTTEGFNLRVDIFMDNPACNDVQAGEYLMPDFVRMHSSVGHRPHFVWQVMNPLEFKQIHPAVVGQDLVVSAEIQSPWGTYDLSGDSLDVAPRTTMTIRDPSGTIIALTPTFFGELAHTHGDYAPMPLMTTWAWQNGMENTKDGIYTLNLTVVNDQNTATMNVIHGFRIGNGELGEFAPCAGSVCQASDFSGSDKDAAGIGVIVLLAALALAARRQ